MRAANQDFDPNAPARWWSLDRGTRLLLCLPLLVQLALSLGPLLEPRWEGDAGLVAAISAKAAWEGHWWTLQLSAEPYFNKPPLAFWAHASLIRLFGPQTWALKLPEVASVLLTLFAVQRISTRLAGLRAGVLVGLLFATTRSITFLIDTLRHDYVHNALLFWGVWFVVDSVFAPRGLVLNDRQRSHRTLRLLLLSGVCVGGSMMVKPFWALGTFPILAVWLALDPHRSIGDMGGTASRFAVVVPPRRVASRLWISALAAIATALPWHLSMLAQHGDAFYQQYFRKQALERVLSDKFTAEPWWWYLDYYAQFCWPLLGLMTLGGLLLIPILWIGRRRQIVRTATPADAAVQHSTPYRAGPRHSGPQLPAWFSAAMLSIVWVVLWTLVLSLAQDKRRNYVLHVIPMMTVLAGLTLAGVTALAYDAARRARSLGPRIALRVVCALVILTAIGANYYCMREWTLSEPLASPKSELGRLLRVARGTGRSGHGVPLLRTIDFIRDANEPIYVGRMRYNLSAIIYVKTGNWPLSHGWGGSPWRRPPRGSLVLFDTSNNDFIPTRDAIVFRSGQFVITRRGWALHAPADQSPALVPGSKESERSPQPSEGPSPGDLPSDTEDTEGGDLLVGS